VRSEECGARSREGPVFIGDYGKWGMEYWSIGVVEGDGRKKACLGHYKKVFFESSKNAVFLQILKIVSKCLFQSMNTGRL